MTAVTEKIAASVVVLEAVGKALGALVTATTEAEFVASYGPVLEALSAPALVAMTEEQKAAVHTGAKMIVLAMVAEAAELVELAESAESLLEQLSKLAPKVAPAPVEPTPVEPVPAPVEPEPVPEPVEPEPVPEPVV